MRGRLKQNSGWISHVSMISCFIFWKQVCVLMILKHLIVFYFRFGFNLSGIKISWRSHNARWWKIYRKDENNWNCKIYFVCESSSSCRCNFRKSSFSNYLRWFLGSIESEVICCIASNFYLVI